MLACIRHFLSLFRCEDVMTVNICGIKYDVVECEDAFDVDKHFGMIDYMQAKIKVNKSMNDQIKQEAICHEMVHGILVHIGYNNLSQDEQFVQAFGNAIRQGFTIKTDN